VTPAQISKSLARTGPQQFYLRIDNEGKNTLNWSINQTLPPWLKLAQAGSIPGASFDSVQITFLPNLFASGLSANFNLAISSNDPKRPVAETQLQLSLQNQAPIIFNFIPNQVIRNNPVEIDLMNHFLDLESDPLSFTFQASENTMVSVTLDEARLIIAPLKAGVLSIAVTAKDAYQASVTSTFQIDNLVTSIEELSDRPNFTVAPNPFDEKFVISITETMPTRIILIDYLGRAIWDSSVTPDGDDLKIEVDGMSFTAGLYICLAFSNDRLVGAVRVLKR
jgi:hypothetical protein